MTEMQSEAELAALLGHELGHVNARHAAQRQGQAMIGQAALVGLNIAVASSNQAQWGPLVGLASQIGASALLASYSRDNEREADALGQEYMVKAGYPASGMTDLHGMLLRQHSAKPSVLETMFSSHPMASERVENAKRLATTTFAPSAGFNPQRERYMDSTSRLRALRPTIDACQRGEMAGARKDLAGAEREFGQALRLTPGDYAANVLMAQCLVAQKRYDDAQRYADQAKSIYPREAQAHKLAGISRLATRDPAGAFRDLDTFDRMLPGDRGVLFLKGVSLEQQGQREAAARHYAGFVRSVPEGGASNYAMSRLKSWGYVR
jgi:predicted Zn-dependent protease